MRRTLVGLACVGTGNVALAQTMEPEREPLAQPSGTEVTLAETLYREGRQLVSVQRYSEAAAKFAESYRLDPATGTLLNLAACREEEGKLASAWIAFSDAMRAARREQRDDRVKFAEEHIAAIEPRLSRLTIEVPAKASAPDLVVRLDGVSIGPAAYGVPTPIDPGSHWIQVSATGKKSWSTEITIDQEGDRQAVVVPVLEDLTFGPPPLPPEPVKVPLNRAPSERERPIPSSVYLAGSTTLALGAASIVTSIVYLGQRSDYNSNETSSKHDSALRMGVVNAVLWGATAVGAGVTIYLYASRPERPRNETSALTLSTWASLGTGASGLSFSSEF